MMVITSVEISLSINRLHRKFVRRIFDVSSFNFKFVKRITRSLSNSFLHTLLDIEMLHRFVIHHFKLIITQSNSLVVKLSIISFFYLPQYHRLELLLCSRIILLAHEQAVVLDFILFLILVIVVVTDVL